MEDNGQNSAYDQEKYENVKKKGRTLKIALIVLAAALVVVAGRFLYVMFINPSSAFDTPQAKTPVPTPLEAPTPDAARKTPAGALYAATPTPVPTLSPEEALSLQADLSFMKNKVNILLLGWDQSPEREDENSPLYRDETNNYRSDVIMLLTINFAQKTVDLISIPRDTYAPIYNTEGRWKINAAFAKGGSAKGEGFVYATNTVSALLGVPIEYYAGVNMEGLKAVVDAMGGVDYDVDVQIKLNGRVLNTGFQHLNGQQVLDYCRARKGISTDIGRADRQQRMLFAIFAQLKDRNQLVNIPKIYASVQDDIYTNLNIEQIAALSVFALSLDMEDLNRHTLAGEYVNNVYNASYYVLDNALLESLILDIFGIQIETNPRYGLQYVLGDKAAHSAQAYIDGAHYLLEVFARYPRATGISNLKTRLDDIYELVPQDVSVYAEDLLRVIPTDEGQIQSAKASLNNAMYTLCVRNGITKAHVDEQRLPPEFYALLPATAKRSRFTPSPTPAPTPAPTPTPEPDWEIIDAEDF